MCPVMVTFKKCFQYNLSRIFNYLHMYKESETCLQRKNIIIKLSMHGIDTNLMDMAVKAI